MSGPPRYACIAYEADYTDRCRDHYGSQFESYAATDLDDAARWFARLAFKPDERKIIPLHPNAGWHTAEWEDGPTPDESDIDLTDFDAHYFELPTVLLDRIELAEQARKAEEEENQRRAAAVQAEARRQAEIKAEQKAEEAERQQYLRLKQKYEGVLDDA